MLLFHPADATVAARERVLQVIIGCSSLVSPKVRSAYGKHSGTSCTLGNQAHGCYTAIGENVSRRKKQDDDEDCYC